MTEPPTHENMAGMHPVRLLAVVMSLAVLLAACGGSDGAGSGSGEVAGGSTVTPSSTAAATPSQPPSPSHEDGSHEDGHEDGSHGSTGPQGDALLALCRVVTQLAEGDVAAAEATFEDEAHETLHEVAHELEEVDRAASAALLQAKSKVEAWLAEADPDVAALSDDVEGLIAAFADSLAALGIDAPACPEATP